MKRILVSSALSALIIAALLASAPPAGDDAHFQSRRIAENYERPLADGLDVRTIQEASTHVTFEPISPQFASQPELIQVGGSSRDRKFIVFVFRVPGVGLVNLTERRPTDTVENMKANVSRRAERFPGVSTMTEVNGAPAMLSKYTEKGAWIRWIRNDLMFDLHGPTITPEQAKTLAALVM